MCKTNPTADKPSRIIEGPRSRRNPSRSTPDNIGIDFGAISLKLAALGRTEDRALLEPLCRPGSAFRMLEWDQRPLVLSDYRRIAGSPIQSAYDLLAEFYAVVPCPLRLSVTPESRRTRAVTDRPEIKAQDWLPTCRSGGGWNIRRWRAPGSIIVYSRTG